MQYKLGNYKRIQDKGQTVQLTCPKCNKKVKFSIFKNAKFELTSKLPLVTEENIYFLVCPECASVFGADCKKVEDLIKGNSLSVGNFDLKELDIFNEK